MSSGCTVKDGSGSRYWLLIDSDGHLIMVGPAAHDAAAAGSPLRVAGVYRSTAPAVANGDVVDLNADPAGRVRIVKYDNPSLQADESSNDSDKSFTVPASTQWKLKSIWVELTSTASAGNRQMCVEIQDNSSDVILQARAGAVQAASLTRYYAFGHGLPDLTAFRDTDYLSTPLPMELILPAGYIVRVYDKAAIDAAADDMVVQMVVEAIAV